MIGYVLDSHLFSELAIGPCRKPHAADAVVCLWEQGIVNENGNSTASSIRQSRSAAYNCTPWPHAERESPAFSEAVDGGDAADSGGIGSVGVRAGLHCLPLSFAQRRRLWASDRHRVRRYPSKKREDPVHVPRSAAADMRKLVVSAGGVCALLVFAAA